MLVTSSRCWERKSACPVRPSGRTGGRASTVTSGGSSGQHSRAQEGPRSSPWARALQRSIERLAPQRFAALVCSGQSAGMKTSRSVQEEGTRSHPPAPDPASGCREQGTESPDSPHFQTPDVHLRGNVAGVSNLTASVGHTGRTMISGHT